MKKKRIWKTLICSFLLLGTLNLNTTVPYEQSCFAATVCSTGKPTKITQLKSTKNSFTMVWNKISSCTGYQIQYASDELFTYLLGSKYIKDKSTTTYTIKHLLENRKYYVRVRTYTVVDGKKVYSAWSNGKSVKTKDDKATNADQEVKARVKAVVNEITTKEMTVQEKLLALHNWMVTYISYNQSLSNTTIYDAVMNGSGICASYAASVQLFCDEMGIPCKTYSGTVGYNEARFGHAWNVVKVKGKWYIYDVTLGDSFYGDLMGDSEKYGWNNYPRNFLVPYDYKDEWNPSLDNYYHHDLAFPKPAGKDTSYVTWAMEEVKELITNQIVTLYKENGYQVFVADSITEEIARDIATNKFKKVAFISDCFDERTSNLDTYLGQQIQSITLTGQKTCSPSYNLRAYTYKVN